MAFLTTKRPATQRESMVATIILAAMMMSGLIYAATSPLDWLVRFATVACIALYVLGTTVVLVLQKREPENAYDLFRAQVAPSACMAILAYMIYGIARHPHDLLPLLK